MQWQVGIAIRLLSSGVANGMHEETEPMRGGIVWLVRGRPLLMPSPDGFAPFATTREPLNVTGLGN